MLKRLIPIRSNQNITMGDEEVLVTIQALRGHVCCSRLYCTVQVVTNRVPREGEELEKEKKEEKKEKERR